jgi:hypothetical protein
VLGELGSALLLFFPQAISADSDFPHVSKGELGDCLQINDAGADISVKSNVTASFVIVLGSKSAAGNDGLLSGSIGWGRIVDVCSLRSQHSENLGCLRHRPLQYCSPM